MDINKQDSYLIKCNMTISELYHEFNTTLDDLQHEEELRRVVEIILRDAIEPDILDDSMVTATIKVNNNNLHWYICVTELPGEQPDTVKQLEFQQKDTNNNEICSTVKHIEKTIKPFLDKLLGDTLVPDELYQSMKDAKPIFEFSTLYDIGLMGKHGKDICHLIHNFVYKNPKTNLYYVILEPTDSTSVKELIAVTDFISEYARRVVTELSSYYIDDHYISIAKKHAIEIIAKYY